MTLNSSLLYRCLVMLGLLWTLPASGVQLLLSEDADAYRSFGSSLTGVLEEPVRVSSLGQAPVRWQNELLVAVGARACQQALATAPEAGRLICSFIPSSAYLHLRSRYPQAAERLNHLGAVYLNQPAARTLALARHVRPGMRRLGVLFGPESSLHLEAFRDASSQAGVAFNPLVLSETDDPVKRLRPVLQDSDVFVVLPDHAVFNRAVAKWMLYMSLRQRVPLVGFSENYVTAGAIAAVYSTPEQLGVQTAGYIQALQQGRLAEAEQFPEEFSIAVNRRVARALRLELAPANVLEALLKQESVE